MKGYIKGKTVILLEELPDYLQEGDEVEIVIPAVETELRHFKLTALKQDINLGVTQLANGDYTEYDADTLPELLENIRSRGQNRLIQLKNESF